MRIALVGCGYVADYYMQTLGEYPSLQLIGVTDRDQRRTAKFSARYSLPAYCSLTDLLADPRVELVVNLTNPRSHYEVSKACLEAGKHVYSEKPLALEMDQARDLVDLAERRGLYLSSAPCSMLSETAQTIWKALRQDSVGKVRLVYAEMDQGQIYQQPYKRWKSASGTPWPYKDEFEVGTTMEHAGYVLTWLVAFFGPVETVTAFSTCLVPDKLGAHARLDVITPDYSVANLRFCSGVIARVSCSLYAPHDHSLRIIGDKGVLSTPDTWFYTSPVYIQRWVNIRRRSISLPRQRYRLVCKGKHYNYRGAQQMDFARGIAELAAAANEHRPSRLSARFSLHVNEIMLAMQYALDEGNTYRMTSSFDPVAPMPWAGC
jgi:predicted dehydrogenase